MSDVINKLEETKKNITNILFKEFKENHNGVVVSTIVSSDVNVPLAESEQIYFNCLTALFSASIWTHPKYGGTHFIMDSRDDGDDGGYGWSSITEKFLKPEEVKQIMIGYIEQIPKEGALEENWISYFCDKYGFDFETVC